MEAYEILGEMLRALHEAFPGTEGEWKSTIGRVPAVERRWRNNIFCFALALITTNGENKGRHKLRFKVNFEIDYKEKDFKAISVEKPTPAEAIAEVLARWGDCCNPTATATVVEVAV